MRRSRHTEFRMPKLLCTSPISVAVSLGEVTTTLDGSYPTTKPTVYFACGLVLPVAREVASVHKQVATKNLDSLGTYNGKTII